MDLIFDKKLIINKQTAGVQTDKCTGVKSFGPGKRLKFTNNFVKKGKV